ncbi:MAG: TraR/DksA family transcriptional regulator [Bacteroidota bacterium]
MTVKKKIRYSEEELKEFEGIINEKLHKVREDLKELKISIAKISLNASKLNKVEESVEVEAREYLNSLAARQYKFMLHLERALERIKIGTYGICVVTGQLIEKERLYAVPHTTHSLAAKKNRPLPTLS